MNCCVLEVAILHLQWGAKGPLLEKAHNYNGNIERY